MLSSKTLNTGATLPTNTVTVNSESMPDANGRAQAYEFLAGIFLKEPSQEILRNLQAWAAVSRDESAQALLDRIAADDPELGSLTQEYYDLFFVPVSGRFIPPFESSILGALRQEGKKTKFGSFWGHETVEVGTLYERTEFQPERLAIFEPLRQVNLPDHLGFELSFIAYLCRLEEKQHQHGLSTNGVFRLEQEFLDKHLNRWLPLLCSDLSRIEQSGYYLYFAQLAQDVCREDAVFLSESGSITKEN
ncbi:hypothetical protein UF75_2883 [Desulfosporosinus sp. I2]|uniref:TorD/DmsD family molecular chaperone n=1 Tax=Desulfosporosinus sp. I2 TaxID=1617025 RepID=UPI00061E3DEE|nr:molecular chaperone TorD family protein [Desulfosporosinus sp. I2]KJR46757.1 hypothetical protein UF75_2883 [Desulfosporosinus sp. I2]